MTALPRPLQSMAIRNPALDNGHSFIYYLDEWLAGLIPIYLEVVLVLNCLENLPLFQCRHKISNIIFKREFRLYF